MTSDSRESEGLIQEIRHVQRDLDGWYGKELRDRLDRFIEAYLALKRERDNWIDSAAQFNRDSDFYQGLVREIGEMFGEEAKTSDDGSIQEDVLALKVPELVAALKRERDEARAMLECWQQNERCHVCGDTRGGVPGNGQIIEDVLLCDYCHADHRKYPRFWENDPVTHLRSDNAALRARCDELQRTLSEAIDCIEDVAAMPVTAAVASFRRALQGEQGDG